MGDPMTKTQVAALPVEQVVIQEADVILFSGANFLDQEIERFEVAPWSHAAMAFNWNGVIMLLECVEGVGVRIWPLDHYLASFPGQICVFRADGLSNSQDAWLMGLGLVGEDYNYVDIVDIFWRLDNDDRYGKVTETISLICSMFVSLLLASVSITILPGRTGYVLPSDLAVAPQLSFIGRIF